jgi:hypothetical protein
MQLPNAQKMHKMHKDVTILVAGNRDVEKRGVPKCRVWLCMYFVAL